MRFRRRKPVLHTLRITYKSGVQYDLVCEDFSFQWDEEGKLTDMKLTGVRSKHSSYPVYPHIEEIESIWSLP